MNDFTIVSSSPDPYSAQRQAQSCPWFEASVSQAKHRPAGPSQNLYRNSTAASHLKLSFPLVWELMHNGLTIGASKERSHWPGSPSDSGCCSRTSTRNLPLSRNSDPRQNDHFRSSHARYTDEVKPTTKYSIPVRPHRRFFYRAEFSDVQKTEQSFSGVSGIRVESWTRANSLGHKRVANHGFQRI